MVCFMYQFDSAIMYSMPPRTVVGFLISPAMQKAVYTLPSEESSQPGTKIGKSFSAAATNHECFGSIW